MKTKMISINKLLLALLVVLIIEKQGGSNAARILAVFPLPEKSHFVMGEVLLRGLAARGHQVDVLSHFPLKDPPPGYRDISLVGTLPSTVNNFTLNSVEDYTTSELKKMFHLAGKEVCRILDQPQFQDIIKNPPKDPPYDVAVIEMFTADCFLGLGPHLNIPVVGIVTARLMDWLNEPLGNPHSLAFVPNCFSTSSQHMNYIDRMKNFLISSYIKSEYWKTVFTQLEDVKKHFYLLLPSMSELYENVAVVLVNTHFSFDGVRPMTPRIVEVGGLHVVDGVQDLSPEVKKWLDESKEGFVYFSLGSVSMKSFPRATIKIFYKTFERIAPVRVLMKISDKSELPAGLPKNVMTSPWLPQTRVLQHENIKAFITHGGVLSMQEAITYGVPMIGIPIFADQFLNIQFCTEKNISIAVDYRKLTPTAFTIVLKTVLNDAGYRERAKDLAKLFTDRPMSALDTATYWVEYIIRNGNVLRSGANNLKWWEIQLLDLYAPLSFMALIVAVGLYYARRFLLNSVKKLYAKFIKKQSAPSSEVALKSKKDE